MVGQPSSRGLGRSGEPRRGLGRSGELQRGLWSCWEAEGATGRPLEVFVRDSFLFFCFVLFGDPKSAVLGCALTTLNSPFHWAYGWGGGGGGEGNRDPCFQFFSVFEMGNGICKYRK